MFVQFISDSPDATSASALGRGGSGDNIRLCIDAAGTAHLVYTVSGQLTYATGRLGQLILVSTATGPRLTMEYVWTHHDNVVPGQWGVTSLFDLAVNSQGTPHLCFPGSEPNSQNGPPIGNVQHAVWDGSQFNSANILDPFADSVSLQGIAMTIAGDDSVHIAFADDTGVHYTKRGANASGFEQPVEDVDTTTGNYSNPSIAVGSGKIGISYVIQPGGSGNHQLNFAQQISANNWKVETADQGPLLLGPPLLGAGEAVAQWTNSLLMDGSGTPHIAFCDSMSRIRHCTRPPLSTSLVSETVDLAGEPSPAKILLDKNGTLFIAYQAAAQGSGTTATMTNVRLANRTITGGWAIATADGSNLSGWSVSAAMHPGGMPHIAYGFAQSSGTMFLLRHTWAMDLLLEPPPRRPKKPPIPPKLPQ